MNERRDSAVRRPSFMAAIPEYEPFLLPPPSRRHSAPAQSNLTKRRKSSYVASEKFVRYSYPWLRFLSAVRFLVVGHWILSGAVLLLLTSSLSFDNWRIIQVNREALLLLWKAGKLPGSLLNETIAFSRAQGIYAECVIPTKHPIANFTDVFIKPRCHSILAEADMKKHDDNFSTILGLITALMFLGPIILLIVGGAMALMIIAASTTNHGRTLMLICASTRTFSFGLCLAFLVCSYQINHHLDKENPAYPMSWPRIIRHSSRVEGWQVGQIDWAVAMLLQLFVIGLDFHHSQDLRITYRTESDRFEMTERAP